MKKIQYLCFTSCLALAGIFFHSGCAAIGVLGTETSYEKKIAAEYDLAAQKKRKILVLVNQPVWLDSQVNLRYYLTAAIHQNLVIRAKVSPDNLIAYRKLSELRSNQPDYSSMSPAKVGAALGADMVLSVTVQECRLQEVAESNYYSGSLYTRTALFDSLTGARLWPGSASSKSVKVGFEVEGPSLEAAIGRLTASCAHCIVRYFYDCSEARFKIFDDRSDIDWEI
ncbi:MAG: hypothetical protein ACYSTF_06855 [Planctomycetota bacterium]